MTRFTNACAVQGSGLKKSVLIGSALGAALLTGILGHTHPPKGSIHLTFFLNSFLYQDRPATVIHTNPLYAERVKAALRDEGLPERFSSSIVYFTREGTTQLTIQSDTQELALAERALQIQFETLQKMIREEPDLITEPSRVRLLRHLLAYYKSGLVELKNQPKTSKSSALAESQAAQDIRLIDLLMTSLFLRNDKIEETAHRFSTLLTSADHLARFVDTSTYYSKMNELLEIRLRAAAAETSDFAPNIR
ncbi:hypothetical protein EBZ37_05975, partial [bacterium]|nr:hypothetical protein [bacterium]